MYPYAVTLKKKMEKEFNYKKLSYQMWPYVFIY